MLSRLKYCYPSEILIQVRLKTSTSQLEHKSYKDIPGPPRDSIWKVMKDVKANTGRYHHIMLDQAKTYGPIVQQNIPLINFQTFMLCDPNFIEELIRQEPKYPRRPDIQIWDHAKLKLNSDKGVFTSQDEQWYRLRNVLNKKLIKPTTVNKYYPQINQVANDFVLRLNQIRDADKIVHNISQEMFNWALESVGTVLYEKRIGCMENSGNPETLRFIAAVKNMFQTTAQLFVFPPKVAQILFRKQYKLHIESWKILLDTAEKYVNMKVDEVENMKNSEDEPSGFIEYIISTNELSKNEVCATITELMAGGVDTTSNTIQFLMYEVAKNPDVQDTLYKEIFDNIGTHDVTPEHLKYMPYLKAVMKETLRLYPTANTVGRVLSEDIVVGDYLIPKGMWVTYVPFVLGRLERLYEEPLKFKPERWLRSNVDRVRSNPFAFLPFGFGSRGCVGRRLAEAEMLIIVSKILSKFKLQLVDERPLESYSDLTIYPATPLKLYYIDRN